MTKVSELENLAHVFVTNSNVRAEERMYHCMDMTSVPEKPSLRTRNVHAIQDPSHLRKL